MTGEEDAERGLFEPVIEPEPTPIYEETIDQLADEAERTGGEE